MFRTDKREWFPPVRSRNSGKNCQSLGAALIRVFLETKILGRCWFQMSEVGVRLLIEVRPIIGILRYMFPPFPLLNKVIQKLRSIQAAEVILIAPWWPKQSWFPHLLHPCVDHPLFFPYHRDLLSQQDQKYVSDGKSYRLHAWRLSCDTTKQQAFQMAPLWLQQGGSVNFKR